MRELENAIRYAIVLNLGGEIGTAQLRLESRQNARTPTYAGLPAPAAASSAPPAPLPVVAVASATTIEPLAMVERRVIEHAIALCKGNIPEASRKLDVAPSTIYRKLAQWGSG